jgi:integrase
VNRDTSVRSAKDLHHRNLASGLPVLDPAHPVRLAIDIVTVAELLGHASLDATRIYTLPTDDDLDAAIARLTVNR